MMHYMSIDQQSNQCTHEHTKRLDFINFHVIFIRNKQIKFKKLCLQTIREQKEYMLLVS